MLGITGVWSHALAAALYSALAVWQLRHWNGDYRNRPLVAAFAVTALWALSLALLGPYHLFSGLAESARNYAFLVFMFTMFGSGGDHHRQRAVTLVYSTVAGVIGLQIVLTGILPRFEDTSEVYEALLLTRHILGFTMAAGALLLVHNLYGQAAPDSRWAIRLPVIALAGIWIYDLHLHTVAYLTRAPIESLYEARGVAVALMVPLFALASRRNAQWKVQLSRAATFQSLSVIAILAYLILMMSITQALALFGGEWVRIGQVMLIFGTTVTALIFLPFAKARAWLRVVLTKHFFEHRYDYRQEWLRFTRTIGLGGDDAAPLGERVVQALADIAGSPAGVLLLADPPHRLSFGAGWNWMHPVGHGDPSDADLVRFLETTGLVIDFDQVKGSRLLHGGQSVPVPTWIAEGGVAWAGIPLLHSDHLVGLVLLAHPLVRRPLDWEDYDLFRTAGIQAASYLAEARSQEALANSHRFDEFNRRFAFIMHDIKNLVSQLSLVARNSERHADNPEFRADMIATLQGSVKKMNDLLARLSRGRNGEPEPLRPVPVDTLASTVAEAKQRVHPVRLFGEPGLRVMADATRLEQALLHIVQNGIDASQPGDPVRICYGRQGGEIVIEVIDSGVGMSADFIRTRLFQPFASTKEGGFGIGAYEARSLVLSMGGRLEVDSREGEGSRFIISLPAAPAEAAVVENSDRMRA